MHTRFDRLINYQARRARDLILNRHNYQIHLCLSINDAPDMKRATLCGHAEPPQAAGVGG